MIYLISALILIILLGTITVLESRKPSPLWKWLNLALSAAGILTVILCRVIADGLISSSGQSETWMEWARDMFRQHYTVSLPVLGILGGILLASWLLSLTEKRRKSVTGVFLRRTVGILASASLLLLAPMYAFMTANESVPMETLILISGMGEALILRIVYALEGFFGANK